MKTIQVPISQVQLDPHNPRTITKEKFQELKTSITDFPEMEMVKPLIVADGFVIGGNMRLLAMKDLGYREVHVIDVTEWSQAKRDEFMIKDNTHFGSWDYDALANEWDNLPLTDWGIDVWDTEVEELKGLTDEDDVPEAPEEPITKLGDVWLLGEHRVMCGDSTSKEAVEILMDGEKADMVFTSPPYNGDTHLDIKEGGGRLYNDKDMDNKSSPDYILFLQNVIDNLLTNTEGFIFWNISYNAKSRNEYLKHLTPYLDFLWETIIWEKTGMPIADGLTRNCEFIFVLKNGELKHLGKHFETNHNLWKVSNLNSQDTKNNHRACFPVELPSKAINLLPNAKSLLDPFLGSGTTLIAAEKTKRKCYGMELDPKYCDVIVKRWEDFTGKKATRYVDDLEVITQAH